MPTKRCVCFLLVLEDWRSIHVFSFIRIDGRTNIMTQNIQSTAWNEQIKILKKNSAKNDVLENPHFLEIFQILTDDFLSLQKKRRWKKIKRYCSLDGFSIPSFQLRAKRRNNDKREFDVFFSSTGWAYSLFIFILLTNIDQIATVRTTAEWSFLFSFFRVFHSELTMRKRRKCCHNGDMKVLPSCLRFSIIYGNGMSNAYPEH